MPSTQIQPVSAEPLPPHPDRAKSLDRDQRSTIACSSAFVSRLFARLLRGQAVACLLVVAWIEFLVPGSVDDPDIWWHLRDAGQQLQTHAFLRLDDYSYTAAHAPWINHEWLAELPFYLGWQVAGLRGLQFVTLFAIELIFLGVYWLAYRQSRSWPCATLITLTASLLATVSFGPRTLLFGWICLVVELMLFEAFQTSPKSILAAPILFAAWINLHGSWLIGIVLFGVLILSNVWPVDFGFLASRRWSPEERRLLFSAFALSCSALLLNPYGWHLIAYPFDLAFHQKLNIAHVEEWQPLDLQSSRGAIFLTSLLALFVSQVALGVRRRRWQLHELAFVIIGVYSAFRHSRFLFLAGILVMPILAGQLSGVFRRNPSIEDPEPGSIEARGRPLLNAALLFTLLLFVRAHFLANVSMRRSSANIYPVKALPFLRSFAPQGPLFNECLWGGFIDYNLPRLPVFIDSRFDIFERNGTLKDYLDIIGLKNSLAVLDRRHVRYVLFEKDTPLVYLLQQTRAWQSLYDDGSTVLLERSTTESATTR